MVNINNMDIEQLVKYINSELKLGRIIKTLEEANEIKHGGDRKSNPTMSELKSSQEE